MSVDELKKNCAWVASNWGLALDTFIPKDIRNEESVIHELCHVATFPIHRPCDSVDLGDLLMAIPTPIAERLEVASWLVERTVLRNHGIRLTYDEVAHLAADSCEELSFNQVKRYMRVWRGPWVKWHAQKVIYMLNNHEWCSDGAPQAVWTGRR
jgi:hypothetical protein